MERPPMPPREGGRLRGVLRCADPVVVGRPPAIRGERAVISSSRKRRRSADRPSWGQVLGAQQHGPDDAQHVTRPDLRRPVDPRAVRLAGVQFELDELLPLALPDLGPDHGALGPPCGPGARPRRPGDCRVWRGSRRPPPGSSCPCPLGPTNAVTPGSRGPRPGRTSGSRPATDA